MWGDWGGGDVGGLGLGGCGGRGRGQGAGAGNVEEMGGGGRAGTVKVGRVSWR